MLSPWGKVALRSIPILKYVGDVYCIDVDVDVVVDTIILINK